MKIILGMREIKKELEELGTGLLRLKNRKDGPLFMLETEVSCIYSQGGRLRRVHTMIWSPTISSAEKINKELVNRGANLMSDGRPIMGLTSIEIADIVLSIDPKALIIPAHIWTPWFSLFGSESGFDSIKECFGDFSRYIFGIETGLSSDPAMNWRIKALDNRSILSFSDAHSGPKLGREATVFELEEYSFVNIRKAITAPAVQTTISKDIEKNKIAYTLEFHPEEGKYHYSGHRNCQVKQTPEETRKLGTICPVCGKKMTIGVMHRVDQLAGRSEDELKLKSKVIDGTKCLGIYSENFPKRPPYIMQVPLHEIISETNGGLPTSKKVTEEYFKLTNNFGSEFNIILYADLTDIARISGERLAQAIDKVRNNDIFIDPGYDGVFGKVKIWEERKELLAQKKKEQMSLF